MSNLAIQFDRVSKKYRLRHGWYLSLVDEIARISNRALGRRSDSDVFWALKDVSFEIAHGETVGLIGSNGAGKSTMLKILSRVTVPTSGSFRTQRKSRRADRGGRRIPSRPDRSRERLPQRRDHGYAQARGRRKFDQIVAFSEVEKFIDTPLKFYSSGMMVRLGFSVAAHIEPEILLVDEVLAVGDTSFQAKCLNKIAELKQQNKTIVLVSHSMPSILQHSSRVLWIDHGTVRAFGEPEATVEAYLRSVQEHMAATAADTPSTPLSDSPIHIGTVVVRDAHERADGRVLYGQLATIDVTYTVTRPVDDPVVALTFQDARGYPLGGLTSRLGGIKLDTTPGTVGTIRLVLSPVLFTRGSYSVNAAIHDSRIQRYLDMRAGAAAFVVDGPSVASREVSGHLVYPHRWETDVQPEGGS